MNVFYCFLLVLSCCCFVGNMSGLSVNETRIEQCTILKFLCKGGHTPIECWRKLHEAFGEDMFSKNTVRSWHKQFSVGRTSTKDVKRPGRPRSARNVDAVEAVRQQLGQDRRKTVRQMAEDTGLHKTTIHTILKKDLNLSKVAPKFIPKLLTDEQKRFRVALCRQNLAKLEENNDFLSTIVSGDESWMSVFEVETKQQSCEWVPKGDTASRPTKALRQRSTKKAMFTVFIDERGPILAEFKDPGTSVDADSYCDLLRWLKENVRRKRPELWAMNGDYRTFQLHHDNALAHTAVLTLALIGESNILMVPHLPYSLDLAVCDFFVFPRLKAELRGHWFQNLRDMRTGVLRTLRAIPQQEFAAAIWSLPIRWMKCISSNGEYFEGQHINVEPEDFGFEITWEDSDSDADD